MKNKKDFQYIFSKLKKKFSDSVRLEQWLILIEKQNKQCNKRGDYNVVHWAVPDILRGADWWALRCIQESDWQPRTRWETSKSFLNDKFSW